jgi:hypothetical protein
MAINAFPINTRLSGTAALEDVEAFATAAQGDLATSAAQAGELSAVATSGAYSDLVGSPLLGTMAGETAANYTPTAGFGAAAFTAATDYATALQGALAESALQSGDVGTMALESALDYTATTGFGSAAFTASTAYATAAQGLLAASAIQSGDLALVATTGAYADLSGLPTLGTAAATASADYATAAQGVTADNALQGTGLTDIAVVTAYPGTEDPNTLYILVPA